MATGQGGFFRYVKKAFQQHWNLLGLAAGSVFAILSGRPDVILPLVGACEVMYLAGLASRPRFQAAVDEEEHKLSKQEHRLESTEKAQAILRSLNQQDRLKFEKIRGLCGQLQRISNSVKGQVIHNEGYINSLHSGSINRLLWIYLKLLYSKNALEQFFATIDQNEIQHSLDRAAGRLDALGQERKDEKPNLAKRRRSLADTLETCQARLANYQLAVDNHEFIELELERLYSKIAGLGELGVNRQDPEYIVTEVDSVSASVEQTEKAMSELQFLTGLSTQDETPPELLNEDSA
jgi:hypothetical protein